MSVATQTWLDRTIGALAPRWQLQRVRARLATDLVVRHFESASDGRRTSGWKRSAGDANSVNRVALGRLREHARDLVRNNRLMGSALRTIANHTVGWGIVAKPKPANAAVTKSWKAWAETTDCDADGRDDLYGLQKLVLRGVAESGEMLVRRRFRRVEDGYAIPLQLQVLEPDFLDTTRTGPLPNGGNIVQGVEFDAIGTRVAYWLYPSHPGSSISSAPSQLFTTSRRIPASEILHIYQRDRAGQVRAVSWFAPIILPAKDLDEYADAQLMKQKIAACLAVVMSDVDGAGAPLGTADDTANPPTDLLSPGAIINAAPGRNIEVVQPPVVGEYAGYVATEHRQSAKGLGLSYEDFAGDYSQVNFSSARMSRLEHYDNVYDWRWRLLVPQFCNPVWQWAMEALQILGSVAEPPVAQWTAPPMAMIEPDKEGLAYMRNIRTGILSWSEAVRERGYDPDEMLAEIAADNQKLDAAGIVLDSDPRHMTQAGQVQADPSKTATAAADAAAQRVVGALDRRLDDTDQHLTQLGATVVDALASRSPTVNVDARTTTTIEEGAVQHHAGPVTVAPASVTVEGAHIETPITIADGAVRSETHVTTPATPPATPMVTEVEKELLKNERGVTIGTKEKHITRPKRRME